MGIRTRRARMHSKTHFVGFGIAGVFGFIALLCVTLALSLGALVGSWLQDLPDYTSADAYLVAEPTRVYDADGNEIASYYLQNRRSVTLDEISDYVKKGVVDTEDKRFYDHNGVDPQGIMRAVVGQLTGSGDAGGGSTITQQLVRNTVLSDEQFENSLRRKVREAYIAIQMEKEYTKDQILNMARTASRRRASPTSTSTPTSSPSPRRRCSWASPTPRRSTTPLTAKCSRTARAAATSSSRACSRPATSRRRSTTRPAPRRSSSTPASSPTPSATTPTSPTTCASSCSRTSRPRPSSRAASRSTPPSSPPSSRSPSRPAPSRSTGSETAASAPPWSPSTTPTATSSPWSAARTTATTRQRDSPPTTSPRPSARRARASRPSRCSPPCSTG